MNNMLMTCPIGNRDLATSLVTQECAHKIHGNIIEPSGPQSQAWKTEVKLHKVQEDEVYPWGSYDTFVLCFFTWNVCLEIYGREKYDTYFIVYFMFLFYITSNFLFFYYCDGLLKRLGVMQGLASSKRV